jgi:transposase
MDAPMVIDGPINGESFLAYVRQVLVPTLRRGDVVIMDNLGSHKGAAVREAIEAAGASLRFLPPDSPDFNPIENAFAKLNALSGRSPPAPATRSGPSSARLSTPSRPMNAETTSPRPDTSPSDRNPL